MPQASPQEDYDNPHLRNRFSSTEFPQSQSQSKVICIIRLGIMATRPPEKNYTGIATFA